MSFHDDLNAVSIAGLDKGKVVAALYNASRPAAAFSDPLLLEAGLDSESPKQQMSVEDGQRVYEHFEGRLPAYFNGRLLRVDVSGDSFNPYGYDRDFGQGAAAAAVAPLVRELARQQNRSASDGFSL